MFAGWRLFSFPERRIGFEPIDQEMTGGERRLAMRRSGSDEHDAVAGFEPTVAMNYEYGIEWPAAMRFGFDLGELSLGHARIVLERQRRDPLSTAQIPHQPHKARDPADPMIAGGEALDLGPDVEILALYADHRLAPRHRRKDGDFVALAHRMFGPDVILIDRHANHGQVPQRLGISVVARPQPVEQSGDVFDIGRQFNFLLGTTDAR